MSNASDTSALAIATLDLSLVQLLRSAIRTADLSSTASAGTGNDASTSSLTNTSTQTVQSKGLRYADKPAATFEKCKVHHWHPRLQELQPYTCNRPVQATEAPPSIQPPWKTLPWPTTHRPTLPPGHRVIKVQQNNTDVGNVGRTLDLFV